MPRNGSEIYAPPAGTKGTPNTTIQSSKYNSFVDDITQDLNTPRPVVMGGTGSGDADEAAANLGLISAKDLAGINTVTGDGDDIVITTDRDYSAYFAGMMLSFTAEADSTSAGATVDVDGVGAIPLVKFSDGEAALGSGDILTGGFYTIRYEQSYDGGDGAFVLVTGSSGADRVGDFKDTARTLNEKWLRRDGSLYDIADYPELADLLPALPDGVAWGLVSYTPNFPAYDLAQSASQYVAVVVGAPNSYVVGSNDGDTWSTLHTFSSREMYAIHYANSLYVAGGASGYVSNSADAATWSSPAQISGSYAYQINSIAYGAGVWVTVDTDGAIFSSADAATWTSRRSGDGTNLLHVRFLNSLFIAVGGTGKILTSTNGTSWTERTSGTTETLRDIAFHNSLYVVVGANGTILSSTTGSTWAAETSGTTTGLVSIDANDNGFVAVGSSGVCRLSVDGETWTGSTTGTSSLLLRVMMDDQSDSRLFVAGVTQNILVGDRTLSTQFRVPEDDPDYGWVRALP